MKRKVILLAIPALMALSACQAGPQLKSNKNLFIEDTLAHEEVFDNVDFKDMNIRKLDIVADNSPVIGIQYSTPVDGKLNIRYVAAIKVESEEALAHTTATWTRIMYDGNGDVVSGKESDEIVATKAYDKINGGGDTLDIKTFQGGEYSYFVVYTMMKIPVSANAYRLNAYLTIDDEENDSFDAVSKEVSTTVDGSSKLSFNANHTDFFLKGVFGDGSVEKNQDPSYRGDHPENNYASFTVDLFEEDTFKIVQCDSAKFRYIDASCLTDGLNDNFKNTSGNIEVKEGKSGYYILYLNKVPELYMTYNGAFYYIRGDAANADWNAHEEFRLKSSLTNKCEILNVTLVDGYFKVAKANTWENEKNWWSIPEETRGGYTHVSKKAGDGNSDIHCEAGKYSIFLNNSWDLYISYND